MAKKIKSQTLADGGIKQIFDDGTEAFVAFTDKPYSGSNFQYLKNPTTGKSVGVSKSSSSEYLQALSDELGFVPVDPSDVGKAIESTVGDSAGEGVAGDGTNLPSSIDIDTDIPDITSSDVFTSREEFESRLETETQSIEDRIAAEEDKKRQLIMDRFAPLIAEAEEYREDITDATEGQFATKRRLSTAALSFVQHQRGQAQKKVDEIVSAREQALAQLDLTMADKLQKEIDAWKDQEFKWAQFELQLQTTQFQQAMSVAGLKLDLKADQRAEQSQLFDIVTKKYDIIKDIPEGETVTIDGMTFTGIAGGASDPFFTGSNIVSLMKSLPQGETTTITDPNTGREFTLTGLASTIVTATDDSGNVTGINKNTGEELWRVAGAGKTKSSGPSTTIYMNDQMKGALGDASAVLEASKGDDGFYNTETFRNERLKFAQTTGGDTSTFDDTFRRGLNPNDPSAKIYFSKSELEVASDVWTEETRAFFKDLDFTDEEIAAWESLGLSPQDLMQ